MSPWRNLSRLDDGWLWSCTYGLYGVKPLNDILAVLQNPPRAHGTALRPR